MLDRLLWVTAALLLGCGEANPPQPAPMSVLETLSTSTQGYARALTPRAFLFPQDHGAHPDFKNEWWYFTGNLEGPDQRRFGFQFTLFRSAVDPREPAGTSAWRSRQIYLAHLALSDIGSGHFDHDERIARGALGLAGAGSEGFHVWLEDWQVEAQNPAQSGMLNVRLKARSKTFALDLELVSSKPAVLHGDRGLSAKSESPGNASYYYSYTRLEASGRIQVDESTYDVAGHAWFDHEWSSSALAKHQTGWDWFSLQLDDGAELMLFQLRDRRGPDHYYRSGTLVSVDGTQSQLGADDFHIEPLGQWHSPRTGTTYPARWRIVLPDRRLHVEVVPLLANQELSVSFRYWEGAVQLAGERGDDEVTGYGYVELTGYSGG